MSFKVPSSLEELLDLIKEELKPSRIEVRNSRRVYVEIKKEDIRNAAKLLLDLFEPLRGRLSTASALDCKDHFEILYHFTFSQLGLVLTLRCRLPRYKPEIDSIADIIYGADFIEREMHDLMGISFKGHPNLKRLLLPDDWPEGVYPLRRYG
ncbi:MAG: NADH-quinone oxidoreductase subunit C [Candidatus Nezhaarchaeota archaeon]|nr:NADH-quinone oxidoreductase subunit C [Candidatus Nezhaarchaeota archaeon]MCX8141259.1 NADH-quinone oxidoreductase subunit C [Candidatus Nezhaarchaeota archaeon]MDW8049525.1 NADH-quinone oxidoreductase subunit C [Nitrososphaerota archaeon]